MLRVNKDVFKESSHLQECASALVCFVCVAYINLYGKSLFAKGDDEGVGGYFTSVYFVQRQAKCLLRRIPLPIKNNRVVQTAAKERLLYVQLYKLEGVLRLDTCL